MWLIGLAYLLLLSALARDIVKWGEPKRVSAPEPNETGIRLLAFGQAVKGASPRYERQRGDTLGWAIIAVRGRARFRLLALLVQPYDDLLPIIPFLVTRWRFNVVVAGRVLFGWNRFTRLDRYKSGLSAWTGRPYQRSRFYHGDASLRAA